jgi:fructose-1,6-bisphosphatase I
MVAEPGKTKFQVDLRRHLRETNVNENLTHLICEIAEASKYIINSIRTGDLGVAGTSNLYGEQQLALDVLADRILRKRLDHSQVVANMMSEEMDEIIPISPDCEGKYSVAFDPLDGSSLVDVNLAVGTIVSIFEGCDLLLPGRHQVAAMYILYGPRTTLVYSVGDGVHEFGMNNLMEFSLLQENITIAPKGNLYSPGGQRNLYTPGVEAFVGSLEERSIGCEHDVGVLARLHVAERLARRLLDPLGCLEPLDVVSELLVPVLKVAQLLLEPRDLRRLRIVHPQERVEVPSHRCEQRDDGQRDERGTDVRRDGSAGTAVFDRP